MSIYTYLNLFFNIMTRAMFAPFAAPKQTTPKEPS